MRKRIYCARFKGTLLSAIAATFFVAVGVLAGENDILLNSGQLQLLVSRITARSVDRDLREIETFGSRMVGGDGLGTAGDWVETQLAELGFTILGCQQFPVTVPVDQESRLDLELENDEIVSVPVYAVWPNFITPPFLPEEGYTAPLAYVGTGRLTDFDTKPISASVDGGGAIALMDYRSGGRWENAAALGAGAVVFLPDSEATYVENVAKFTDTPLQFPRFYLDNEEAATKLVKAAEAGATATLNGGMEWRKVTTRNIVAMLPANAPDETVETLLLCVNYDAAAVIPGIAHGGQSATNLAAAMEILRSIVEPALDLKRKHNLLVLFDSARTMDTAGLRAFASVVRDINAERSRKWTQAGTELNPRQKFILRKMADVDPWMHDRENSLEIRLGRVNAALEWLRSAAGPEEVGDFEYEDPVAVTPSELIPQKSAALWLRELLADRVKKQQIDTLNETSILERRQGVSQFAPDSEVSAEIRAWRRRQDYYRGIVAAATPEDLIRRMLTKPLAAELRGATDVTYENMVAELEHRQAELTAEYDTLRSNFALRGKLADLDITRGYVLDISAGDTMLTLARSGVGGDRVAPSPQAFEWTNSLAPIIKRNLEHISIVAQHILDRENVSGQRNVEFDFVGEGDHRRQANPAPFGMFNQDLSLAGISNFTLVTGNDHRTSRMGPGNRVPHDRESLRNVEVQAQTAALLLAHVLRDPGLTPHYEKNTPWCSDVMGIVVKQDVRAGPFPKLPVAGSIVVMPAAAEISGSTFQYRYEISDSLGHFRFDSVAGGLQPGHLRSFKVSEHNGMLSYAPDEAMSNRGGYETTFSRLDKDIYKRIVVFEGACVQLYDAVDPMLVQPLAASTLGSIQIFEGKGGALDKHFIYRSPRPTGTILGVVPRESHIKILATLKGFGNRLLLLGDQSEKYSGTGYAVGDGLQLTHTAGHAARDLWTLNDHRLSLLTSRGIRTNVASSLHKEATADLKEIEKAQANRLFSRLRYLERNVWGRELRAYPDILDTTDEAIMSIIILLVFMAPWAVFMERVFLQAGSIRGRIGGSVGFFGGAFAVIYFLHPAFQISRTPIMILVAYTLAALAMLALGVILGKYGTVMKRWREKVGGIHQSDISRAGAFTVAFNLGLSNMAKRRLRTVLTIMMIALLAFSVMTFTSIEPYRDTRKIPVQGIQHVDYEGILFRLHNWSAIQESIAGNFVADLGPGVTAVYRNWYMYVKPGTLLGPNAEGSKLLFSRSTTNENKESRQLYHTANFALGFMPEERQFSNLDTCVIGTWFTGARDEVILPDVAAAALDIDADDILGAASQDLPRVKFGKDSFRVIGILDSAAADQLKSMSGTNLSHVDFFLSGIQSDVNTAQDIKGLTLPVGDEVDVKFIPFTRGALLPYEVLREIGGHIRYVAARFPGDTDAADRIDDLMARFAMNIYASIDGKPYLVKTASSQSVEGAWRIVLPLLLVVLIMVNLMFGTVDERQEEIKMLGAVGLAPRHVTILYLAESCALGVLGIVFGVLLGLGVSLVTGGMDVGVDVNYASVPTMLMGVLVLIVVVVSTLIPASRAARLATPSGAEEWDLPESTNGAADLRLPFTMTRENGVGIFTFLFEYLDSHWESTSPDFRCTELTGAIEPMAPDDSAMIIRARVWLAPYDMRVSQTVELILHEPDADELLGVTYRSQKLTGELNAWNRANFNFIDLLRQQFLIYRTLSEEHKENYVNRAPQVFAVTPVK